jgi:long-chain acyl-CoA synthetase
MADGRRYRDLCDLYESSVRRYSDKPVFGTRESRGWHWLSYRDFAGRVDLLRSALFMRGIKPGDRVALIAPNSVDWAAVAFATFTAGGILVPVYPYQRYDDWLEVLQDADPKFVFTHDIETASAVHGWRGQLSPDLLLVCMSGRAILGATSMDELTERALSDIRPVRRPEDPKEQCALIYTSGSTGQAKGVELSHANLVAVINDLHQIFPVNASDRSLAFLPWSHAFGQVVELYGLFSMGASLAIAPNEDEIVKSLQEVKPTLLFSVPKLFNRLYDTMQERIRREGPIARKLFDDALENARQRRRIRARGRSRGVLELKAKMYDRLVFQRIREHFGGRVRYAMSGGAQLAPEVAEFVDSLGITLYEGYGLTEASPIVSANWPGARRLGSVGKPLPCVRVMIDHNVGPNSRDGEIIVYGPNVTRGYRNAPEETARALTPEGGLRTGDVGYIDRDGFLYVTGRLKEQYKLENGRFVAPSPLEAELQSSRFVRQVMLYGDGRPHNVALIVPEFEVLEEWAGERGIRVSSRSELVAHPEIRACLAREVERCSEGFRQFEKVRAFALLERDFSVEDGTLTHTMKIRRREVAKRYRDVIDALYGVHRGERAAVD